MNIVLNNISHYLSDKSKSILFVGIGNRLKSDDAVGIHICENLKQNKRKKVLIVESGIEKYIGKINSLSPDILVLVDCTDFGCSPGYVHMFQVQDVLDNTIHTHTISLLRISEFFNMQTYVLGIQPEYVGFGEIISTSVMKRAKSLIEYINNYV